MATDNREKVEIPQIHHISNFIGKRVKARIPPRFWGRISKAKFSKIGEESILIRGVPEKNPSVLSIRANTELKSVQPWRIVPLRRENQTRNGEQTVFLLPC